MKRYKLFLFIYFLIFANHSYSSQYKQFFIPQITDQIEISFTKKNLKKYFSNLSNISQRDKVFLEDKNWFKIKIKYKNKVIMAKARIAGHSVDHVDFRRGYSSLSIKLKDDHIGHITNFRLLKLGPKNFENEIFWSSLMESLGYPTPYSRLMNVKINENNFLMVFQEKTEKEFLERWSIRESPIIEGAYKQFKALQGQCVKQGGTPTFCFKRYINSIYYSNRIENKKFIKNINSAKIAYKAILFNNYYQLKKFYKLNLKYANHGLSKKNSKFFYDPIYNFKHFIYYDGDVKFNNFEKKDCKELNLIKPLFNETYEYFANIYFERTNISLDKKKECIAKKYINNQNNYFKKPSFETIFLENNFEKNSSEFNKIYLSPKKDIYDNILGFRPNYLSYSFKDKSFQYCINKFESKNYPICNKIENITDLKELLSIDTPSKKFNQFDIYDLIIEPEEKKIDLIRKVKIIAEKYHEIINIEKKTTVFLKIKEGVKIIDINLIDNNSSRIVIHGYVPENIKIVVNSKFEEKKNIIIYDENSLTGCVTFLDTILSNVDLKIENTQCEDAVNFIRSSGSINYIKVKNSISDAIDMDFSKLHVNLIEVDNASNDCLDLSYGEYIFEKIKLSNCGDKALSIGEKSKANVKVSEISNSNIAVATKDSSISYFDKFSFSNINSCFQNYKKKQEFDGGITYLRKEIFNKCKNNIYVDNSSKINFY